MIIVKVENVTTRCSRGQLIWFGHVKRIREQEHVGRRVMKLVLAGKRARCLYIHLIEEPWNKKGEETQRDQGPEYSELCRRVKRQRRQAIRRWFSKTATVQVKQKWPRKYKQQQTIMHADQDPDKEKSSSLNQKCRENLRRKHRDRNATAELNWQGKPIA